MSSSSSYMKRKTKIEEKKFLLSSTSTTGSKSSPMKSPKNSKNPSVISMLKNSTNVSLQKTVSTSTTIPNVSSQCYTTSTEECNLHQSSTQQSCNNNNPSLLTTKSVQTIKEKITIQTSSIHNSNHNDVPPCNSNSSNIPPQYSPDLEYAMKLQASYDRENEILSRTEDRIKGFGASSSLSTASSSSLKQRRKKARIDSFFKIKK